MRELLTSGIVVAGVIIASACSNNAADTCTGGTTQVCQDAAHDNCICAPDCTKPADCDAFVVQVEGASMGQTVVLGCTGANTNHVPSICIPLNWSPGQKLAISSASAGGYIEYGGIDWRGTTATEAKVDSSMPLQKACGAACDAKSGCISFTLRGNSCFISNDVESPVPDLTSSAFMKTSGNPVANFTVQTGTDAAGNDFKMLMLTTTGTPGAAVECARECDSNVATCAGFTMGSGPDAGKCWLKSKIVTQSASNRDTYTRRP